MDSFQLVMQKKRRTTIEPLRAYRIQLQCESRDEPIGAALTGLTRDIVEGSRGYALRHSRMMSDHISLKTMMRNDLGKKTMEIER